MSRKYATECPGSACTHSIPEAHHVHYLPEREAHALRNGIRMRVDPRLRACPRCMTLVAGGSESCLDLQCPNCNMQWCFLHELAHEGRPCAGRQGRANVWQRLRNGIWKRYNTVYCRMCHAYIEKNQGCDHITCKCRHEICWRCGKDYVFEDGHRGHIFDLFPKRSEWRYCCNDWKQWCKRVGLVVAAVTAGPPAICILGPIVIVGAIIKKVRNSYRRRRDRRRYADTNSPLLPNRHRLPPAVPANDRTLPLDNPPMQRTRSNSLPPTTRLHVGTVPASDRDMRHSAPQIISRRGSVLVEATEDQMMQALMEAGVRNPESILRLIKASDEDIRQALIEAEESQRSALLREW